MRASRRLLYQRPDARSVEAWKDIYRFRSVPQLQL
jgi:hypothetical protein